MEKRRLLLQPFYVYITNLFCVHDINYYYFVVAIVDIYRHSVDSIAADQLAIRVSTFNANQLPVESSQISPPPILRPVGADGLQSWHWFEQFFLQVPLDNLEDHSYCTVELVRRNPLAAATAAAVTVASTAAAGSAVSASTAAAAAAEAGTIVLASTRVSLDRDSITSEAMTLTLMEHTSTGKSNTVHSTLDVEMVITRR